MTELGYLVNEEDWMTGCMAGWLVERIVEDGADGQRQRHRNSHVPFAAVTVHKGVTSEPGSCTRCPSMEIVAIAIEGEGGKRGGSRYGDRRARGGGWRSEKPSARTWTLWATHVLGYASHRPSGMIGLDDVCSIR